MSKQSEAKASQGYVDKVVPATCSTCAHCITTMSPVLVYIDPMNTSKGTHKVPMPTGQACGLGGFKVKKLACCDRHTPTSQVAADSTTEPATESAAEAA